MLWEENEIELLAVYLQQGYTHREIARELSRTESSVKTKCLRLGFKSKNRAQRTTEQYKIDLRNFNESIEVIDNYITARIKILHKCIKCKHEWKATPDNIMHGYGCPNCADYGFNTKIPAVAYLVYIPETNEYKIGISNNLNRRIKEYGYVAEIIFYREFDIGEEARTLENIWKENIKPYKSNSSTLKSGFTETFIYNM